MSMEMQNYIVYLIVGVTIGNLLLPILKNLSKLLPKNKQKNENIPTYSTYTDICSKCTVKE